jgi:OOP family OmpA-OmpF porin
MKHSTRILSVAAFVVATSLCIGTAVIAALRIEDRSTDAVAFAMREAGMDWVAVSANGLQINMTGTAPDEAARLRAFARAAAVVDADRIVNTQEVVDPAAITPPRFSLDMLRNGDGIQLIGLIPTEVGSDAVAAAIAEISAGVEVINMVETADYATPPTWVAAMDYGLRALQELPRSKVTVYEDRVEVQAISESAQQRALFEAILARGQPDGVTVVLDISAPRPVITPFALRYLIDDQAPRFEACSADTIVSRDRIVTAARGAGTAGMIDCTIGLGVPSPQWGAAVATSIAALAEMGGGSVTFSDADVTLIGPQGMAQDAFDRAIGELDQALPAVFSLQGVLPAAQTANAGGTPRFVARLTDDGTVELRGRLPDDEVEGAVQSYANALFGGSNVDFAARPVADLPPGWTLRVLAGLAALSRLNDGSLTVQPDTVILTGNTGNPDMVSDISRALTIDLGDGQNFEINVTYQELLDPVASLPTPEECVARINDILVDTKITFDPGSVQINRLAGVVLDDLADILPDCREVRMEIGGHTDSQGREDMNLNLSQARANAVLDGLLSRSVLVSNLTAQGYGESQPIDDNTTEDGREANRRIEFRLLAGGTANSAATDLNAAETLARPTTLPPADFRPVMRPARDGDN